MSSELRTQLNNIVEEKNSKIIPENIRAGVTIFDVEGALVETDFTDITATASDVMQGVSAYGKDGEKIEGTYVPLDTSDANATPSGMLKGQTAYVDNKKIEGTMESNGYLTYSPSDERQTIPRGHSDGGYVEATDITKLNEYEACLTLMDSLTTLENYTETTAKPEDIAIGKTAYSNGEKITGTLTSLGSARLPSDYQEVTYIQSSGTQWINTKVNPKQYVHACFVDFMFVQGYKALTETWIFGQWYGSNGWRCGGATPTTKDSLISTNSVGFAFTPTDSNFPSSTEIMDNIRVVSSSIRSTITSEYPMLLFAQQEGGNARYYDTGAYKLFGCKIWEWGKLIRDFVPCYRKEDNMVGLFDMVSGEFYMNSGTGNFIAGAKVE